MAGASQESKGCVPVLFHESRAAGLQQGSAAGVRGGGMWKPNRGLTFNRRAEGTSELNRRLGAGGKGAGALERCGADGDYGWGCAG